MKLLGKDSLESLVTGIVHVKTQLGEHYLDLTLASIHRIESRGSLDFGGSEMEPARLFRLRLTRKARTISTVGGNSDTASTCCSTTKASKSYRKAISGS